MKKEHEANSTQVMNERNEITNTHHSTIQGTAKRAFPCRRLVSFALTLTLLIGLFTSFPLLAEASSIIWDGTIDTQWDGQGTETDPYLISGAAELAGLSKSVADGNRYEGVNFKLTADIVLNDTTGWQKWGTLDERGFLIYPENRWIPIGIKYGNAFEGNFDGNEHTVSGIYINTDANNQGLFGYVWNGIMKNIRVIDSYISGYSEVGGVIGMTTGTVTNCTNTGTVSGGGDDAGGVVGFANGKVTDCTNAGTVSSNGYTGGVVGSGNVTNCINTGTVSGKDYVGGVVGGGNATNCNNTGTVSSSNQHIGGVVGSTGGTVTNCYNTGTVSGSLNVGGVIGIASTDTSNVSNCYNTGTVNGINEVGGVIGSKFKNEATITDCHNNGAVIGGKDVGGIVGYGSVNSNCYNTGTVSGSAFVGGIVGYGSANTTITGCYNTGWINGESRVGGVAGSGTLTGCYNTGRVSGSGYSIGGIVGYGNLTECYNTGTVIGIGENVGGVVGYSSKETGTDCYYLNTCITESNSYGAALTNAQMKTNEAFVGFDFDTRWEFGATDDGYFYPTLINTPHLIIYAVTFMDADGETVIETKYVKRGDDAVAPDMSDRLTVDADYVTAFDHWYGDIQNIMRNVTVMAVYQKTAIIKFLGRQIPYTVEAGYSADNLRADIESLYGSILCTTTNDDKMSCPVKWDISSYEPVKTGVCKLTGHLILTDSPYYKMADGAEVSISLTVSAEALQAFQTEDLTYQIQSNDTVLITGYHGNAAHVNLPEVINGKTVTAIANDAFASATQLHSVFIPGTVASIGARAFRGCTELALVAFNEGLLRVGAYAFADTALVKITLPSTLTDIGNGAFGYYGTSSWTDGFVIYAFEDSAGETYAGDNRLAFASIHTKMDEDSGIFVTAEEKVTLTVSEISQGSYFETAEQIQEDYTVAKVFEIFISDGIKSVQPENTVTVSIPVPAGFDAVLCKIYCIYADGSAKDMHAVVRGDRLIFLSAHLSYYALISMSIPAPVLLSASDTSVTLMAIDGYEYRCGDGAWQTSNVFDWLLPNTEYTFYQRIAETDTAYASDVSPALQVTTLNSTVSAPAAPTVSEKTDTTVTLVATDGYEYKCGDGAWQTSNVFDGLSPNTEYAFYQRIAETSTSYVSDASAALTAKTSLWNNPFTDVKSSEWFYESVSYAYTQGLFFGTSAGKFSPLATMTRSMLVTVLYRIENEPQVTGSSIFTDVPQNQWYTDAVIWANQSGYVKGTSDTTFAPDASITRQDMVSILYRYALGKGYDTSIGGSLDAFKDANEVSDYARNAVLWAVGNGMVKGSNQRVMPKNGASRAEVAAILMRFCETFK